MGIKFLILLCILFNVYLLLVSEWSAAAASVYVRNLGLTED